MASSVDYVLYVCEQMSLAGEITYKKMFGEYAIYCDTKVLGLICDNQVFIKPTAAADAMMPNAERLPPYEGAKPHIVLDELDDIAFLTAFICATCRELPMPKPKKKKEKKHMDYRKEFERMMQSQAAIALATSVDGFPNVRIVNFYYDTNQKTLYFATFGDNQKIAELLGNPQVAFTTIPTTGEEHIRVKSGVACKSTMPLGEIKDKFLAKLPEYIMSIPDVLPALVLFEITFDHADVVLDFEHMETIAL